MRARTIAPAHIAQGSSVTYEGRLRQAPAAQRLGGRADREDLGVGRGVGSQLALVARRGEGFAVTGEDGADRHVAVALRLAGTLDRQRHQPLVRGRRCVVSHASESMCTNNFAGGIVL